VDSLAWTEAEKLHGKMIQIKGFPADHKVKLFRVVLSGFGEVHGLCCDQRHGARRHTGCTKDVSLPLEGCQCGKARIIRNHIACTILVWIRLKQVANEMKKTFYHLKHGLLADYLRQQLKLPAIHMMSA
jgi:hypothetical protein